MEHLQKQLQSFQYMNAFSKHSTGRTNVNTTENGLIWNLAMVSKTFKKSMEPKDYIRSICLYKYAKKKREKLHDFTKVPTTSSI